MELDRRTLVGAAITSAAGASASSVQAEEIVPLRRPASGHIKVAFLVDSFANLIDIAGPWEAFGSAGSDEQHFACGTVAATDQELRLGQVRTRAEFTLENAPQPHVIVIGAQSGSRDVNDTTAARTAWLQRSAPQADIVMSVCTGAFLLARSGLIDGKAATTHHDYYDDFERQFPHVQLVRNRRFVDNGKFVSGGGLTSGIDAALHVIARYYDINEAARVAAYLEHYSDGWRTGVRTAA